MRLEDFDFELPAERIALRPARPRDSARLLGVAPGGALADRIVAELPAMLRAGDLLVLNDTRVIPAALSGLRPARLGEGEGVAVAVNLHRREGPGAWRAFARPGKRLRLGDRLLFAHGLEAQITEKGEGGEIGLGFNAAGEALDAAIALAGAAPLPPYIADRRAADAQDAADYQTLYAENPGAVAAPTAGLHFTPKLLAALGEAGIARVAVTLHVGAGTFLPVKTDDPRAHAIHAEWREISPNAAAAITCAKAEGRRVIAVGTTALRTLESAADGAGGVRAVSGETDLYILPGFGFRVVDGLLTNFHLPRSTLFMLVCAFAGTERMRAAYAHAIAGGYRFYSYGDASLLWRAHG